MAADRHSSWKVDVPRGRCEVQRGRAAAHLAGVTGAVRQPRHDADIGRRHIEAAADTGVDARARARNDLKVASGEHVGERAIRIDGLGALSAEVGEVELETSGGVASGRKAEGVDIAAAVGLGVNSVVGKRSG